MGLAEIIEEVRDELEDNLSVIASDAPAARIGAAYDGAETGMEALACCKLLLEGDRSVFRRNLYWAALARRHYLTRTSAEGAFDAVERARSRSRGMFCALAAGDHALAKQIGDLSPTNYVPGAEYEDDFAFHYYVHLVLSGAETKLRTSVLDQFERALEGGNSPRLALCLELEAGGRGFESVFIDLVEHHEREMSRLRPQFMDQSTFEPRSRIFVEGLALVSLATSLGLPALSIEHPLLPSIAQLDPMKDRPEDIFVEIANA